MPKTTEDEDEVTSQFSLPKSGRKLLPKKPLPVVVIPPLGNAMYPKEKDDYEEFYTGKKTWNARK